MEQLTPQREISFHRSGVWLNWTDEQIARLQLFQKRIIFEKMTYLKAIQNVLKRPVFEEEIAFNHQKLIDEYLSKGNTEPTLQEFIDLMPLDKKWIFRLSVGAKKQ